MLFPGNWLGWHFERLEVRANAYQRYPLRYEPIDPSGLHRHGAQSDPTPRTTGWRPFEHRPHGRGHGFGILGALYGRWVKVRAAASPQAQ
jgi:hypothetical protein